MREKDLKLFSAFENSDIIVASPLAMKLVIGNKGDSDRKFSFLSSI